MSLLELIAETAEGEAAAGRIFGAVIGIVSNVSDPDSLGRVKVRYPWLKDDSESPWARVVSFMAGKDRGAVFRPDVGDEVVVLFHLGDINYPFVIGALWNGKDGIPSERGKDADNAIRLIKSKSGHQILLDDTSGSEKITVLDKAGNSVELSSSGVVIKSNAVKVGSSSASEGLVLGDAFMKLFNQHTHPTGVGPSGPPANPMVSGSHVSTKHKTE
jgi:uncharacterized protein involved in type VI secretion and phage assembly